VGGFGDRPRGAGRLDLRLRSAGWAIVRWVFNFIEKNRDAGIDEVAKEVKEVL
jgi:very-short-patch-repair endonuclease